MPQRQFPKFTELTPEQQANPYIQRLYRNQYSIERQEKLLAPKPPKPGKTEAELYKQQLDILSKELDIKKKIGAIM